MSQRPVTNNIIQHPVGYYIARKNGGFSLIELVFVIVLIAILSYLMVGRLDVVGGWRVKTSLRQFVRVWETIYADALAKQESYRLIVDLNNQSYYVRREIGAEQQTFEQVDRLSGFRSKTESARRTQREQENLKSVSDEYAEQDERNATDLETQYYSSFLGSIGQSTRLGIPLNFPDLGNSSAFADGLEIKGIKVRGRTENTGTHYIRVSRQSGAEFAVVHLTANDQDFTVVNDPGTGKLSVLSGHVDFDWKLRN